MPGQPWLRGRASRRPKSPYCTCTLAAIRTARLSQSMTLLPGPTLPTISFDLDLVQHDSAARFAPALHASQTGVHWREVSRIQNPKLVPLPVELALASSYAKEHMQHTSGRRQICGMAVAQGGRSSASYLPLQPPRNRCGAEGQLEVAARIAQRCGSRGCSRWAFRGRRSKRRHACAKARRLLLAARPDKDARRALRVFDAWHFRAIVASARADLAASFRPRGRHEDSGRPIVPQHADWRVPESVWRMCADSRRLKCRVCMSLLPPHRARLRAHKRFSGRPNAGTMP